MNNPKQFYVGDGSGGYGDTFEWSEAVELAIEDTEEKNCVRVIESKVTGEIVALFFGGKRYIPASGQICENCHAPLAVEPAHYSYDLTGRFFCSQKCGIELGVLSHGTTNIME